MARWHFSTGCYGDAHVWLAAPLLSVGPGFHVTGREFARPLGGSYNEVSLAARREHRS